MPGGKSVRCHCPNPGSLLELCIPGSPVLLQHSTAPGRKTAYSAVAAFRRGRVIPLDSTRTNSLFRNLLLPTLFPGAAAVKTEPVFRRNRLDFSFFWNGRPHAVEVKTCTLVESETAMFPDAPSKRALHHLNLLAELKQEGIIPHLFFLVMNPEAERLIPNIHTDPEFSEALDHYAGQINLHAAVFSCSHAGDAVLSKKSIPVLTEPASLIRQNRGVYLVILELPEGITVEVGKLGVLNFDKGFYIYTGSAMGTLKSRTARHLRRGRKRIRWHIDYLTTLPVKRKVFPIYTAEDIECKLAASAGAALWPDQKLIPGFGSSDCRCRSHLLYSKSNPLLNSAFADMILAYRHAGKFQ
ncbi:MAG: DNA/RNA nuclease SfsA [Spirochaetia bacterium]